MDIQCATRLASRCIYLCLLAKLGAEHLQPNKETVATVNAKWDSEWELTVQLGRVHRDSTWTYFSRCERNVLAETIAIKCAVNATCLHIAFPLRLTCKGHA